MRDRETERESEVPQIKHLTTYGIHVHALCMCII